MSPSPDIIDADDLAIVDGNLTWANSNKSGQVKLEQLLFVLEPSGHRRQHLVCCLVEQPTNADSPYQLVVLRTHNVPSQVSRQRFIPGIPHHLSRADGNNVDIIVSTKSGMKMGLKFWETVLQPLLGLFYEEKEQNNEDDYHLLVTQDANSIPQFARDLWAIESNESHRPGTSKTVILLSGDGGIVDLLNGGDSDLPATSSVTLAVLPLGTGNALFHSIHKPLYSGSEVSPLVLSLRTLFQGKKAKLPVFRATFSPGSRIVTFTNKNEDGSSSTTKGEQHLEKEEKSVSSLNGAVVASYGFHATLIYESDTPEYRLHGDKRFGMVAKELLTESHAYAAKAEIRRPGSSTLEPIPRDTHAYLLTTPLSNLERTFTISPSSRPLDSRLRLVHFGPIGGERTMDVMMKAYDEGKHIGLKWDDGQEVGYDEIDEVRIDMLEEDERWRKVCIDGTSVEIPRGGHMTINKLERGPFRILAHPEIV